MFGLCLHVTSTWAQTPTDAPIIIGQIKYKNSGLQESEKRNIQGYFSYKLRSVSGTHVVLNANYFQKNVAYSRCDRGICMAAMGRSLGANRVIQTRLLRLGKKCAVQCTIFNVEKKKPERVIEEEGSCSQENLFILVDNVMIRLLRFDRAAFATRRTAPHPGALDEENDDLDSVPPTEDKATRRQALKVRAKAVDVIDRLDTLKAKKVRTAARQIGVRSLQKASSLIRKASDLYIKQNYAAAIKKAQQALKYNKGNSLAIQIIGVSACYLKQKAKIKWAYRRLPPRKRSLLKLVCQRNGVQIKWP